MQIQPASEKPFRILALDGGGAKGIFTVGVLSALEEAKQRSLWECFDLIYGVSTGAIIAAYLAFGTPVNEIKRRYLTLIPKVMRRRTRWGRTRMLSAFATEEFKSHSFSSARTRLGLVALNRETRNPLIFKSHCDMAHSRKESFRPGFGCTIPEALLASCAAYPYFKPAVLRTDSIGTLELLDGGFAANSPALFAIADAAAPAALNVNRSQIRLLSVGVGSYPAVHVGRLARLHPKYWLPTVTIIDEMMGANAHSNEFIRKALFGDVQAVRVDKTVAEIRFATNLLESDPAKLEAMFRLGTNCFSEFEIPIGALLS